MQVRETEPCSPSRVVNWLGKTDLFASVPLFYVFTPHPPLHLWYQLCADSIQLCSCTPALSPLGPVLHHQLSSWYFCLIGPSPYKYVQDQNHFSIQAPSLLVCGLYPLITLAPTWLNKLTTLALFLTLLSLLFPTFNLSPNHATLPFTTLLAWLFPSFPSSWRNPWFMPR